MKRAILALLVAGVWITLLCTAPQLLGAYLWREVGIESRLPLRNLVQVVLNSAAVLAFILLSGRAALLVPRRPAQPAFLLVLLPLAVLNVARGPLAPFDLAFYGVVTLSTFLTGFWEEFLFRGLIQGRLSVLGYRFRLLATAAMFALIHWQEGVVATLIAFSIGLIFCVGRDRVGMWPLVVVHFLIDLTNGLFIREWESFYTFGHTVVGAYLVLGTALVIRGDRRRRAGRATAF